MFCFLDFLGFEFVGFLFVFLCEEIQAEVFKGKKQNRTSNARKLLKLNCIIKGQRITFCLHLNSQEHNETNKDAQPETWYFFNFVRTLSIT